MTYSAKAAAKRRMNISQYAEHRGCSRQAVYKAMDEGRITREPDGSIDPVRADRQWADNTCPASRWATSREDIVLSPADLARILDA